MVKKVLALLLTLTLVLSMSGCTELFGILFLNYLVEKGDDRADKDEVFEFVREHEEELLKAVEEGDFSAFENKGPIKDINADEDVVDFSCGGVGMGPETAYVGFYYTRYHDMTAVWSQESLVPCGNGFEWCEPIGDDRYYTEQICGNFYYYEQSY